jgi:hypothetical protein
MKWPNFVLECEYKVRRNKGEIGITHTARSGKVAFDSRYILFYACYLKEKIG